jgi:DNA-3-methyladenine glycosylase
VLARDLLGKVIRHRVGDLWLSARIIETEAYYCAEKGSHASLGYTEKRKALFLDGGHIYMYYARGGDSLNFSAQGPGNAVLIKSAYPWVDAQRPGEPGADAAEQSRRPRPAAPSQKLCAGQTLLCKALGLKVREWDAKRFDHERCGGRRRSDRHASFRPPPGHPARPRRTPDVPLRRRRLCAYCTRNPLRRGQVEGGLPFENTPL